MKIKILTLSYLFINVISAFGQTVTDVDGNTYNTVSIGDQVWLSENLKVTKFNNQEPIPLVLDDAQWPIQNQSAYCYYQASMDNVNIYGNLYNWYVVKDSRNVCPSGYYVPSITEWEELVTFLGGTSVAGGKLKELGFSHWANPNTGADNSSNYTLLPSGWRANNNGVYENLSYMTYLWSSTPLDAMNSSILLVGYDSQAAYTSESHILTGLPIRCLKDKTSSLNKNDNTQTITVYPNPSNEVVNVVLPTSKFQTAKLIALNGKLIMNGMIENDSCTFDISSIESGVYFILAEGINSTNYTKIVISH